MDMTEQKNDFGVGSVEQNIIRMAVPMTVAQILNLLYNLVDRMYIGHIPGASSLALTGVGITFPIISMITAFANLFGMAAHRYALWPEEDGIMTQRSGICRMRSGCSLLRASC